MIINKDILLNQIYPVGSIYMSTSSTNPGTLFGGTWEQLKDRFLLGAGTTYANGKTGGEASHVLTVNEMPNHNHSKIVLSTYYLTQWPAAGTQDAILANGSTKTNGGNNFGTSYTGGSQAHNNMPPYLVVYMWKRTA